MEVLEMHAILQDMVMGNLLHPIDILEMIHAQISTHGPKVVILLSSDVMIFAKQALPFSDE